MKNVSIETLDSYITQDLWRPTMDDVCDAVKSNAQHLQLLSKVASRIPHMLYLNRLSKDGREDVLGYILSLNLDWKPSLKHFHDAIFGGFEGALKFYASVDPDVSPSKEDSLRCAYVFEHWGVLAFCLERWPQYVSSAFKRLRTLRQGEIDVVSKRGFVKLAEWATAANIKKEEKEAAESSRTAYYR
ncbi:hypothetical protein PSACC_02051 [Paramicrosporidium saccamoebae]|uniref:Uncharacterized protein n=1 Tax=Paramicrosporidium saccamoebae TaxID=1246581 RepID=A0A2H9TK42_9FUNG|nr:hypothetical protein PSACC_02051 [Paramicrosporidium saccamoebae]